MAYLLLCGMLHIRASGGGEVPFWHCNRLGDGGLLRGFVDKPSQAAKQHIVAQVINIE